VSRRLTSFGAALSSPNTAFDLLDFRRKFG
jgi:hypothetical protein